MSINTYIQINTPGNPKLRRLFDFATIGNEGVTLGKGTPFVNSFLSFGGGQANDVSVESGSVAIGPFLGFEIPEVVTVASFKFSQTPVEFGVTLTYNIGGSKTIIFETAEKQATILIWNREQVDAVDAFASGITTNTTHWSIQADYGPGFPLRSTK